MRMQDVRLELPYQLLDTPAGRRHFLHVDRPGNARQSRSAGKAFDENANLPRHRHSARLTVPGCRELQRFPAEPPLLAQDIAAVRKV